MMDYNILEILSYVIVAITTLTMLFGVFAYKLYKIREKRVVKYAVANSEESEKEKYLYFEEKELLW